MTKTFTTTTSVYMKKQNSIVCITGLTGAGKSRASEFFVGKGYQYVRFGQLTEDELNKRGLKINEINEKRIREDLRKKHGMAAFATLNLSKFKRLLKTGNVIADGLYSFEEYKAMKRAFEKNLVVITIYAPPGTRYKRLAKRKIRPLKEQDAKSRDFAEIENLNKGGTIAMSDFTITNTRNLKDLEHQTKEVIKQIAKS